LTGQAGANSPGSLAAFSFAPHLAVCYTEPITDQERQMRIVIQEGVNSIDRGLARVARAYHKQKGVSLFAVKAGEPDFTGADRLQSRYNRIVSLLSDQDDDRRTQAARTLLALQTAIDKARRLAVRRRPSGALFARMGNDWKRIDWQAIIAAA